MPRAPRICGKPGCPKTAGSDGRCAEHKAKAWAKRADIPRTSGAWRREVLNRDNHTCRNCGRPASEADHIVPRADAPHLANDPDNGQALCKTCHAQKTIADRAKGPQPR